MQRLNPLAPEPPDFDKMTWLCHCCGQHRTDRYIKVNSHDTSQLFNLETGVMFVNVRYCNDMPACKEKASNREWVIKRFFPKFIKDENASLNI